MSIPIILKFLGQNKPTKMGVPCRKSVWGGSPDITIECPVRVRNNFGLDQVAGNFKKKKEKKK